MSLITVFMHDHEIVMSVGIYPEEHITKQRVLVNIEAQCTAERIAADQIEGTVSYELFVQAVERIAARKHYNLLELFVEDIADAILENKKILKIKVKAEKPDVFKGNPKSVGVEITRP